MKFTVSACSPVLTWEGVEAKTKKEAIAKCALPSYYGSDGDPIVWIAEEVEPEDKEEEGDE